MPALNRVQLIGRLGKEPELRTTNKGTRYAVFSVAVDHRWKTSSGEARKNTDWFNIEAWGRLGEVCLQYLRKGQLVFLEGRLHTDRYEQEGDTRYFTKVIASAMQMLEWRGEEEPSEPVEEQLEPAPEG